MRWLLSKALRYSLYEQAKRVPLAQEWQFVEDYIELQSMRLPYQPMLLIKVPEEMPDLYVPPFVLITFVENAFKHGDLQHVQCPVRIKLACDEQWLYFCVSNRIQQRREKDPTGGIGLENTRQRLNLLYGEQHEFDIQETEDHFTVQLKIPLRLCTAA